MPTPSSMVFFQAESSQLRCFQWMEPIQQWILVQWCHKLNFRMRCFIKLLPLSYLENDLSVNWSQTSAQMQAVGLSTKVWTHLFESKFAPLHSSRNAAKYMTWLSVSTFLGSHMQRVCIDVLILGMLPLMDTNNLLNSYSPISFFTVHGNSYPTFLVILFCEWLYSYFQVILYVGYYKIWFFSFVLLKAGYFPSSFIRCFFFFLF